MIDLTQEEKELILRVRELQPFQKIELTLFENRPGTVVISVTTKERLKIKI